MSNSSWQAVPHAPNGDDGTRRFHVMFDGKRYRVHFEEEIGEDAGSEPKAKAFAEQRIKEMNARGEEQREPIVITAADLLPPGTPR